MTILKRTLAILTGVAAAGVCVAAVEAMGHAALQGQGVFAAAVAGYGLAALIGSVIAARIGDRVCAAIVTLVLAILAVVNLFAFPHPAWFAPVAVLTLALGWAVGTAIACSNPSARGDE